MRNKKRLHRKNRIRAKIFGTSKCPRVSVFKSLKGMYVQVIDDDKGKTIISSTVRKATISGAKEVGKDISEKCAKSGIKKVVFDRSGYKYHGKVKALADEIRKGGIKF